MMKVIAVTAVALMLAGCSANQEADAPPAAVTITQSATPSAAPDLAGCRTAIGENYATGWDNPTGDPWPPATRTPVCSGIDRPTLQRLMDEASDDAMNGTAGPG